MNKPIPEIRLVLEEAGFLTSVTRPDSQAFLFEDDSVMGQLHVFVTARDVLGAWEKAQDEFLQTHLPVFRRNTAKAWNLYTVLIATQPATDDDATRLSALEEDFRSTRKIARAGVSTRDEIMGALAPLLPFRNNLTLDLADTRGQWLDRVAAAHPSLRMLGADEASPAELANRLLEDS